MKTVPTGSSGFHYRYGDAALAALLIVLLVLGGCKTLASPVYESEPPVSFQPDRAYLILGQSIGRGNLSRMAVALYLDRALVGLKGVQAPGAEEPSLFKAAGMTDFRLADGQGHTYRVWALPPNAFEKAGRAFFFPAMLAAGKQVFMDRYPFGLEPFFGSGALAPVDMRSPEGGLRSTFVGCPVLIDGPGVYYLGELKIEGVLTKKDGYPLLDGMKLTVGSAPEAAGVFASAMGLPANTMRDASAAWRKIATEQLGDYMAGEPNVEYMTPAR